MKEVNDIIGKVFDTLRTEYHEQKDGIDEEDAKIIAEIMCMLNRGVSIQKISKKTGVSQVAILAVNNFINELASIERDTKRRIKEASKQMRINYLQKKGNELEESFEQVIDRTCKNGYYLRRKDVCILGRQEIKSKDFMDFLRAMVFSKRRRIVIESEDCIKATPEEMEKIREFMKKHDFVFEKFNEYLLSLPVTV
ncbi:MAG: hypothetical protein IJY82_01255 [Oscillospiraceae bacterium]|nr:hypothetical protein [Oscillospiraceae bacterium]